MLTGGGRWRSSLPQLPHLGVLCFCLAWPYLAGVTETTLLRAVRHNVWANLELLSFCSRLSTDQLAWKVPGTFGSIHETLQHVVRAESYYLRLLTGEHPPQGPF